MALGMTRAEMLSKMDSAELSEWIAFTGLEPFGVNIDLLGHAITASTVANVYRNPKKTKGYKPKDFMPMFEKVKQTEPEMIQRAQMLAAAGLGEISTKEKDSNG